MVSTSSTEAEYIALSNMSKEILYIRHLLESMGLKQEPTEINADNQGSIFLSANPKISSRTKHFDIKFHHIRELVENKIINIKYIKTNENLADGFTKPLPITTHQKQFSYLINQI